MQSVIQEGGGRYIRYYSKPRPKSPLPQAMIEAARMRNDAKNDPCPHMGYWTRASADKAEVYIPSAWVLRDLGYWTEEGWQSAPCPPVSQ